MQKTNAANFLHSPVRMIRLACDFFAAFFAFLRFVRVRDMCASVPLSNPPLECPLPLSRVDITCGSLSWGQPLILPTEAEQPPMVLAVQWRGNTSNFCTPE